MQAEAPGPAKPDKPADTSYGLLQWRESLLALPVAHLREVVPCPPRLAALPCAAPGVRGAVVLRGTIIPVLDLGHALGLPPLDEGSARVVVLMRVQRQEQSCLLGLLAEGVRGIACGAALQPLWVGPSGPGLPDAIGTHVFMHEGATALLLDAVRIAALPGVPLAAEPPAAHADAQAAERPAMLLLRVGAVPLGLPAVDVDATVPRAVLRDSPLRRGACLGVIEHHGLEVPVLDTLALLGLGRAPPLAESAVVVLRCGAGRIGLVIDEVRDIVRVDRREVLPLQALGLQNAALFSGMLATALAGQVPYLLVDSAALCALPLIESLAGLNRRQPAQNAAAAAVGQQAPGGARSGRPYLSYRIEVETASPLTQVSEIVAYPAALVPLPRGDHGTIGLFSHRGAALPLVCLGTLLGREGVADTALARVLVVEDQGRRVGLLVQALCAIENARWEQAHGGDDGGRGLQPLIEVGRAEQRRTLPRLDLLQVVRGLHAKRAAEATPALATAL